MVRMVKFLSLSRSDRQAMVLLFALALALYLRMLAPGLLSGDAGEFQFAAWRFGLAHPTGYPLYLLVGGAWQRLLALMGIAPATALNAFSAVIGAAAVALFYGVMRLWLSPANAAAQLAASFAAVLLIANPTVWSQNLIAEVYGLHLLFLVLILAAFQRVVTAAPAARHGPLIGLALLVGLSLTHHAMTLLFLPGLLIALLGVERRAWGSLRTLLGMLIALLLPLLLYLYIPWRSGPEASPWYHQRLGDGVLTLYDGTWSAFVAFVTGQSISVGFYDWAAAWARLPLAGTLWLLHFTWVGLVLMAAGLYQMIQQRQRALLVLTATYALLQQIFNLFYAIEDILVYYIPLYLIGAIWCGFAVHGLATGFARAEERPATAAQAGPVSGFGILLGLICFLLPIGLLRDYYPRLDQSGAMAARQQWEAILAADPPADAILISNDRNEIVPLFYLQAVEARGRGLTGLFPLIQPGPTFATLGATVTHAWHQRGDQPVYLIKPMPGLEIKFDLQPAASPLVQVVGLAAKDAPHYPVNAEIGPVQLLGYDWQRTSAPLTTTLTTTVALALHWAVVQPLDTDYTTTVQLFDENGDKLAQEDQPAGGVYYPTSHWQVGDRLVERHELQWPADSAPARLLIGLYTGPDLRQLAPPLELPTPQE